jgi:dimethylhistidine N-methyltransferase
MVAAAGGASTIVELGAGTAKKTMLVLRASLDLHRRHNNGSRHDVTFIPVDVSSFALGLANDRVRSELPQVAVHPLVMDYTHSFAPLSQLPGAKLILYIGSSIGNFEPMAASALLRRLRSSLNPGDSLLLGVDMRKPVDVLLRAYDDSEGVTARFNLNILTRINREFEADFDLSAFEHCVRWSERHSRIEMHLRSRVAQSVRVAALDLTVDFDEGETIHTENSYKFTPSMLEAVTFNAGFAIEQSWSDERNWFTVTLLRA